MSSPDSPLRPCLGIAEVSAIIDKTLPPETRHTGGEVEAIEPGLVRLRLDPVPEMRRSGDIVSGPTIMALSDVAAYAAIVAHAGPQPMAVTNSLAISFLRACAFETIYADASILKLGRTLATVDVRTRQGKDEKLIAQATVTFTMP